MREIRLSGSMSGDWKRGPIKGLTAPVLDSKLEFTRPKRQASVHLCTQAALLS